MKKLLCFILLHSVAFCFSQSDLAIQSFTIDATSFHKEDNYNWSLIVQNNGNTASIVNFKIYLSDDNLIDPNDLILNQGIIRNPNIMNSGLPATTSYTTSSNYYDYLKIPGDIEPERNLHIIVKIDQDIANGETNTTNNSFVYPIFLSLKNKVQILEQNSLIPLGNRTPLFLIHGWQPKGYDATGDTAIWNNFVSYYNQDATLQQNFKIYFVKYRSNIVSVDDLAHEFRKDFDNWFGVSFNTNISIVAHSMGGLVARSFMNREKNGIFGGDKVNVLITLGTPHHGSPMANGEIRLQANSNTSNIITLGYINLIDNLLYFYNGITGITSPFSYNRLDLRWDNYDGLWANGIFNEPNNWLNSNKMNLNINFDSKLIPYGSICDFLNTYYSPILTDQYTFLGRSIKNFFNLNNDGIVPISSAHFYNHNLVPKRRTFYNYKHDEIATGIQNLALDSDGNGLDDALFGLIKVDLLQNTSTPIINSSQTVINYPNTAISNNITKNITIQNNGDNPLTISSIQFVGSDNSHFDFNFPTAPIVIQSNQSETFNISFSPNTIGQKTLIFRINNNSVNVPQLDITLNGLAVETANTDYDLNTDPLYDFGDVSIYGQSKLINLTVFNNSSSAYTVTGLNISGLNSNLFSIVEQPDYPKLFNPGDFENIVLKFEPNSVGEKTAIIEATFADNSILDSANLKGNGINQIFEVNAPNLVLYEYWFNDDYANKQSINIAEINSSLDLITNAQFSSSVNKGLNKFHFRIKDENGKWSSVISEFVFISNINFINANKISAYRYWFNQDFSNLTTVNETPTEILLINDGIENLNLALNSNNQIHFQFKDLNNNWSSVITDEFLVNNLNLSNNDLKGIKVYPNPSESKIYIINNSNVEGSIMIFNNLGQKIKEYPKIYNEIDISHLQNGIYYLKIESDKKVFQKKIIKH